MAAALERLTFDNRAVRVLPVDTETKNFVRQVAGACFSRIAPTPVVNPRVVAWSASALELLGISAPHADLVKSPEFAKLFGGCHVPCGAQSVAHCYCGHQFGSFAGQLGDGAAILLGEVIAPTSRVELQLKGAGLTPYSRTADGRKVLRSSLREFLCSEAMHALNIPTTRAASIVTSDTRVTRDPLYNGNVVNERCSVVARLASTFIRFGSFEVVLERGHASDRAGPSPGNVDLARALFDFTAVNYFSDMARAAQPTASSPDSRLSDDVRPQVAHAVFAEVLARTARLVASWQAVGFCHGVLNTDNMSIVGDTIDYGPFAFMEYFFSDFVCNQSDDSGRYSYENQPRMCEWNMRRLAEAWGYLVLRDERAAFVASLTKIVDADWQPRYDSALNTLVASKLGISADVCDVAPWRAAVFAALEATHCDVTATFATLEALYDLNTSEDVLAARLSATAPPRSGMVDMAKAKIWRNRPQIAPQQVAMIRTMAEDDPERVQRMFNAPLAAVMDHLAEQDRKAQLLPALRDAVQRLDAQSDTDYAAANAAVWSQFVNNFRKAIVSGLSDVGRDAAQSQMRRANPRQVLRPWLAQAAIEAAEAGDHALPQALLDRLASPFAEHPLDDELERPDDAHRICVSCSS